MMFDIIFSDTIEVEGQQMPRKLKNNVEKGRSNGI